MSPETQISSRDDDKIYLAWNRKHAIPTKEIHYHISIFTTQSFKHVCTLIKITNAADCDRSKNRDVVGVEFPRVFAPQKSLRFPFRNGTAANLNNEILDDAEEVISRATEHVLRHGQLLIGVIVKQPQI